MANAPNDNPSHQSHDPSPPVLSYEPPPTPPRRWPYRLPELDLARRATGFALGVAGASVAWTSSAFAEIMAKHFPSRWLASLVLNAILPWAFCAGLLALAYHTANLHRRAIGTSILLLTGMLASLLLGGCVEGPPSVQGVGMFHLLLGAFILGAIVNSLIVGWDLRPRNF